MKRAVHRVQRNALLWSLVRSPIIAFDLAVRCPLWLRSRLRFGAMVSHHGLGYVCHWIADLNSPERIRLGYVVVIGVNASIGAHSPVHIGNHVRISRDVMIKTAGLDFSAGTPPYAHISAPIRVREGAWIGTRSNILDGVTISRHAVVAAGSVVNKDVPDGAIVTGIPSRVVRR